MTIASLYLVHPHNSDERIVHVTVAASQVGHFTVTVARGNNRNTLANARGLGPFTEKQLAHAHKGIVDALLAEGYLPPGTAPLLLALREGNPRVRARAALRLSWRREARAVEPLLKLLDKSEADFSTVVDALGLIGDVRAQRTLGPCAEAEPLPLRRAGVEALRNLAERNDLGTTGVGGAGDGLKAAHVRARARLPEAVRSVLEDASPRAIEQALLALPETERGLALDTTYELAGMPASLQANTGVLAQAVRAALCAISLATSNHWRYAKSVWKRAMLRGDFETFGLLTHRIEIGARTAASDIKDVRVCGEDTANYVRRRSWRYLRLLAQHRPDAYAQAAAWALVPYVDGDDVVKVGAPVTGRSYLLHRVLFAASERFTFRSRAMRFVNAWGARSVSREEAFAALWDRAPRAYVILLAHARHTLVRRFALAGVLRSPSVLPLATTAEVALLLDSDEASVVDLALHDLRRRFAAKKADLEIVCRLAGSAKPLIRNHALLWLSETAPSWSKDSGWILRFLSLAHPAARGVAARVVSSSVRGLPMPERRALAHELLMRLQHEEVEAGAHAGYAEVLRGGLLEEAAGATSCRDVLAMLEESDSARAVGVAILAHKPGALELLGRSAVEAMTRHHQAAVRQLAMTLLAGSPSADPSLLGALADSDRLDVRCAALALLDRVELSRLGVDGLIVLANCARSDVEQKARQLLERAIQENAVDVQDLLCRLGQQPPPVPRAWVVKLIAQHLGLGIVRLAKLEPLLRFALFDARPDRVVKRCVIELLAERGQQGAQQAAFAARILGDVVRTPKKDDRERALMALVHIALKFPGVKMPIVMTNPAHPPMGIH